jgi:hypothetical protein
MRQGEWHVVAASGWLPIEPEKLQTNAIELVRKYGADLRALVPNSVRCSVLDGSLHSRMILNLTIAGVEASMRVIQQHASQASLLLSFFYGNGAGSR